MPDQSSAASEHAILQEITAPLETLPDDPVAMVHADFPTSLRGYDRLAVDAYVQQISQMVAELQATRSPEAAVRRALERVGEQISGILHRAHETAEQITTQSRREAEERLEQVRGEAAELIEAAEQRVRDLDADTDRIWIDRGRIVDDARDLARQLLSVADTAADRFPEPQPEPGPVAATEVEGPSEQEVETGPEDEVETGPEDEVETGPEDEVETAPEDEVETAPEDETRVYEDVETTVRYDPLQPEPKEERGENDAGTTAEAPAQERPEPQVRGTRAAIPPASQAANRRQRD